MQRLGAINVPMDGYYPLVARLLENATPLPLEGPLPLPSHTKDGAPMARAILHLRTHQQPLDFVGETIDSDKFPSDVRFRYGAAEVTAESPADRCIDPETHAVIMRDFAREGVLLARLLELGAIASSASLAGPL